jgi:hypothetical protein
MHADTPDSPSPTPGFRRVVINAVAHAQADQGRDLPDVLDRLVDEDPDRRDKWRQSADDRPRRSLYSQLWFWVLIGAACWGLLVGVLDGWSWKLEPSGRAVVIASLALLAAGGIERDFPRAVATLIQNAIVLAGFAALMVRALGLGPAGRESARSVHVGADLARYPASSP